MKKILLIFLIVCVSPNVLLAILLPLNGSYTTTCYNNTPDEKKSLVLEAQRYAAKEAVEQMINLQPSAIQQLYEERKPDILNGIMEICTQVKNTQSIDAKQQSITINFSAMIEETQLKDLLQRKPAIQKIVPLEQLEIAVFFTARHVSSVVKQSNSTIQINTLEKRNLSNNEGDVSDESVHSGASLTEQEKKETGTAKLIRSDQISYELDAPAREEFGTALIARFTEKGFEEIIDGSMFEAIALLDESYGAGNVVPAKTWRDIISHLKTNEPNVEYMVVGTLDMGTPREDAQTNMWVVEATVSGKIYKISSSFPRIVAALAPQTQKGKASDQLQAKKRALSGLTPLAADEILAKLKAKNIIKK
ncbi:MAG: hypothetical protein RR808_09280 [Akkermansia sp.]